MNAEEEEKENERNIQFILSSFTVIYVNVQNREENVSGMHARF